MSNPPHPAGKDEVLRGQAIERLRERAGARGDDVGDRELHELQVFQEELLMQQENLAEVNARLSRELARSVSLFDEAPIPYLVLDRTGMIRELNLCAAQALGKPRASLKGRLLITCIHPESTQALLKCLKLAFTQHGIHESEVRLRDQPSVWRVQIKQSTEHSQDSEPRCLLNAFEVTKLRIAETQLRAAQVEAERASYLKGRFLANMSHEVRTPLTLILGFVDTLLEEEFEPDVLRRLKIVHRAGRNLLGVLNDVVDFSKIEANRLQIDSKPFEPHSSIDHVRQLFQHAADSRSIRLTLVEDEDSPLPSWVHGDGMRLGQVLVNLVSNSMKFTPDDGKIALTAAYRSRHLILSVEDTGPGIPEEQLETIFEPFRQVDGTDSRSQGGAGLGLAISRQVLNLMGGDLYVRNSAGGGACFTLQLPLSEAAEPQVREREKPQEEHTVSPGGPTRILLVEDDEDIRVLVTWMLSSDGYSFDQVTNGAEALDAMRKQSYGLVLMDIQMPVMDGLEAMRQIRADAELRGAYVVALTARALKGERTEVDEAGFDGYFPKPIDLPKLKSLIASRLPAGSVAGSD